MTTLAWKLNRLRAMEPAEIVYRGQRWISQKVEARNIEKKPAPLPKGSVSPRLSLLPELSDWRSVWKGSFQLNEAELEKLTQGWISLFGHDYLEVGQPVDWHRDPVTGIRSPLSFGKTLNYRDDHLVGNVKFLWELGRHQHLIVLAAAYSASGNPHYRKEVVEQIEGWITENPYGLGIHWCSALELALRLIAWAMVHSLFVLRDGDNGLFSAVSDTDAFGTAIYQQCYFIRNFLSLHSSANNHLIGELTGLWVATQVFELGEQGAQWALFAQQALEREAELQIYPDGVNKEQACYYHLWVMEYLLFAWLVGEQAEQPFSATFKDKILAMASFLKDITPPGGKPPAIGDSDDGFVTRFDVSWPTDPYGAVLDAVSVVFDRPELSVAHCKSQKSFWYGMMAGRLPEDDWQKIDKNYPILYRNGGYAILGNETMHLVFDAGSLGYPSIAAHGHADALSFCLALKGEWWIVDPGTYAYHSESEWRNYFRGTRAHNTIAIDRSDQSEMGGPFLWVRHANAGIESFGVDRGIQSVNGWHDGYHQRGFMHSRKIQLDAGNSEIEISDKIEAVKIQNSGFHAEICFHFAPDVEISMKQSRCMVSKPESDILLAIDLDDQFQWAIVNGQTNPIQGWYSFKLNEKVAAPVLCGEIDATGSEVNVCTMIMALGR